MEELCSRSVPLEHAPGAKPLVCIGLKYCYILDLHHKKQIAPQIEFYRVKKPN